ncbi:MAG: S1C family serine protease [Acetobacteraceae bacterium]
MPLTLPAFSAELADIVASAAPLLVAIRIGQNRHITGIHWHSDTVVTADQALPALESYTLVMSNGALAAARPGPRDPGANLALLRLDHPIAAPAPVPAPEAPVGSLVLVLGADLDGAPTARLSVVHRRARGVETSDSWLRLDMVPHGGEQGGPALDAHGRLLGMASIGTAGDAVVAPYALVSRLADPQGGWMPAGRHAAHATPAALPHTRRGWLGVALQPITVPDQLIQKVGQASGRMVVNVTTDGPADCAGLRVGDVLLSLDGHSTSGSHALRAFLGADRIGRQVEVRLLRDGSILTTFLTVAAQPNP